MHNLHEIRARLYRRRNADEDKRYGDFNLLTLSDSIEINVAREIRERVKINFVNKGRGGRSRPAESGEGYDSRLAGFAEHLAECDCRNRDRRCFLMRAIYNTQKRPGLRPSLRSSSPTSFGFS